MGTFTVVMAMLVAVLLSGVLVRMLPLAVPLPFVQIDHDEAGERHNGHDRKRQLHD